MADEKGKDKWSVFTDPNKYELRGFLQMCIERRFHAAVQKRFQDETGLKETEYWIHTDVGGSPQMEGNDRAPIYCHHPDQGATIMGWSAHGSKCGGLEGKDDDTILKLLMATLAKKPAKYPLARHFGFFAKKGQIEGEVEVLFIEPEPQK